MSALPTLSSRCGDPTSLRRPSRRGVLLGLARFQDERDIGDLAPSYWDAGAGTVVLGAVTDAGVGARRNIGESSGTAYRIERRASQRAGIEAIQHAVVPAPDGSARWSVVDAEHNRVELASDRLSHSRFANLATRFGADTVAVVAAPFAPLVYIDERPANPPSWWSRADPPGTWLTLATGFPWYLASAVAVAALFWILPLLRPSARPTGCRPPALRARRRHHIGIVGALGSDDPSVASVAVCERASPPGDEVGRSGAA